MALMVKTLPANAEDTRIVGSILESRRPFGVGNGKYFCLENPMDRGACWATVNGVAKSWT